MVIKRDIKNKKNILKIRENGRNQPNMQYSCSHSIENPMRYQAQRTRYPIKTDRKPRETVAGSN